MVESMPASMLTQHLIGLCYLRHRPEAVDIVLSDLSSDANRPRTIDTVVTVKGDDGAVHAFKVCAAHQGAPLDVTTTEQLCVELSSMPNVARKTIVSAAGYAGDAIAIARSHDVSLLVPRQLTKGTAENHTKVMPVGLDFGYMHMALLHWCDEHWTIDVPTDGKSFEFLRSDSLFSKNGDPHKQHITWGAFQDILRYRSTSLLFRLEPAQTVLRTFTPEPLPETEYEVWPEWPHTHTLDLRGDEVFLKVGDALVLTEGVTISGKLQWRRRRRPFDYYVLRYVENDELFGDAAVADWGTSDGRVAAIAFASDSSAEHCYSTIALHQRHQAAVQQLQLLDGHAREASVPE